MKRLSILAISLLLCPLLSASVLAAPIFIENHSFEHYQYGEGPAWTDSPSKGPYQLGYIYGWDIIDDPGTTNDYYDDAGTWAPTTEAYDVIPDGNNVAYSKGDTISQTLSAVLTEGYTYTLGVYVGNREDNGPFPEYSVGLWAGGAHLASTSGIIPALGEFVPTVTYTAADSSPYTGENLEIRLDVIYNGGYQVSFDNVTLDVVPEPTTILLFGIGLIGIAGTRRKLEV